MQLSSEQVYEKLLNDYKLYEMSGMIHFFFGGFDVIVKQKDVVGNILQEWLQAWFKQNGIEYALNENSQMPPDFFLNVDDIRENLLEVKAFNINAKPAFDIANFWMYIEELLKQPYVINTDYLIFGYDLNELGIVTVKRLWLKKIWEITRPMKDFPINVQKKRKMIYNIRPSIWYGNPKIQTFGSMQEFVIAMHKAICLAKSEREGTNWLRDFLNNCKKFYGDFFEW